MGNKNKVIRLTLSIDGQSIYERDIEKGCEPIVIGRSRSCTVYTPSDDHSISSQHARLYWKGSALFIEDAGSRNGVYHDGKKLEKPEKVDFIWPYALGRCQLAFAEVDGVKARSGDKYWKLEFLNSERAHEVAVLKPAGGAGDFWIGSAEDGNDIVLKDSAISRRHVRIAVKADGACWICDNSSRNGSTVNGEKLPPDRERLLKNGDTIALAYLKFQIHQPPWNPPVPLWRKAVVAIVTLLVLVAGYQIYLTGFVPQATEFLRLSEKAAALENFEEAEIYAQKAVEVATGADKPIAESALRKVRNQQTTWSRWQTTVEHLQKGDLSRARRNLSTLLGNEADWGWNREKEGSARKGNEEAAFCQEFFRVFGDPDIDLKRAGEGANSRTFVTGRVKAIDDYFRANDRALATTAYLATAVKILRKHRAALQSILDGIRSVDKALADLKVETEGMTVPDFTDVIGELERVADEATLPVGIRHYAKALLPCCRRFLEVQAFLKREKELVVDLKFEDVRDQKEKLPIPGMADCALHNTLSNAREAMIRVHGGYQAFVSTVAPMVRNLETIGIRNNEKGAVLNYVTDGKVWQKALAFDCFSARFPLASRVDPTSAYDELLGIEYTYENLRELPKPLGRKNAVLMNFVPKCQSAKATFDQVKTFQKLMERPDSQEFRTGRLGGLYALAAQILADREGLSALLRKMAAVKAGADRDRSQIVAGYYAEYFSDEPSYADLRALEMAFKKLQKRISALNEKYDAEGDPEKRLKIKKEILALGIPGMEAVRRAWVNVE